MRGFLSFLLILLFSNSQAQSNLSNSIKVNLGDRNNLLKVETFLIKAPLQLLKNRESLGELNIDYAAGDIYKIRCNYQTILNLSKEKGFAFAELPSVRKQPLNDTMLVRNHVVAV